MRAPERWSPPSLPSDFLPRLVFFVRKGFPFLFRASSNSLLEDSELGFLRLVTPKALGRQVEVYWFHVAKEGYLRPPLLFGELLCSQNLYALLAVEGFEIRTTCEDFGL